MENFIPSARSNHQSVLCTEGLISNRRAGFFDIAAYMNAYKDFLSVTSNRTLNPRKCPKNGFREKLSFWET